MAGEVANSPYPRLSMRKTTGVSSKDSSKSYTNTQTIMLPEDHNNLDYAYIMIFKSELIDI